MPAPVKFDLVKRLLESKGYRLGRISSSHYIFQKAGVPHLSIPVHNRQVKYVYYRQAQNAP